MEKSLAIILVEIGKDILDIVRAVMASDVGINSKTGTNTLKDSDIYKELKVLARKDGDLVYDLMVNQYIDYIENGRRAGAKWPPTKAIEDWYKKKFHRMPTNSTLFLIRRSIAEQGIRPRKIFDAVFERLDKTFDDKWSDDIFNLIIEELDKYFRV